MISYAVFLATTDIENVRILNLLAQGQKIQFDNPAEAEALAQRIQELDEAGLLLRHSRIYEKRSGIKWQSFEGLVEPVASAYLAQAASERLVLSRDPLPVPEA